MLGIPSDVILVDRVTAQPSGLVCIDSYDDFLLFYQTIPEGEPIFIAFHTSNFRLRNNIPTHLRSQSLSSSTRLIERQDAATAGSVRPGLGDEAGHGEGV